MKISRKLVTIWPGSAQSNLPAHLKDLNRWAVNFEPPFNRIEARNCNGGRGFLSRANPKLDGRIIFQPSPGDR
jgi:hypothetical protein